jgi:hypothetical protein
MIVYFIICQEAAVRLEPSLLPSAIPRLFVQVAVNVYLVIVATRAGRLDASRHKIVTQPKIL